MVMSEMLRRKMLVEVGFQQIKHVLLKFQAP